MHEMHKDEHKKGKSALLEAWQHKVVEGPDRSNVVGDRIHHDRGIQDLASQAAEMEGLEEALDLAVGEDDFAPGKPPPALPWPSPRRAAWAYTVTLSISVFVLAIAMLGYMGDWPFSLLTGECSAAERVQGYCLSDRFFGNFIYSIVLPDSFSLSISMSQNATYSGWIIGIYKGLSLLGLGFALLLCSVHNKAWIKNIYPCIVTGKVMAFIGSLMFLFIVVYRDTVPHAKEWLLFSRAVAGIGNGIVMIPVELIFVHTTTAAERPTMLSKAVFNVTLGIGLGPLVASAIRQMYSTLSGTSQGEIEAVMALPVVVSMIGLLAVFFVPSAPDFMDVAAVEESVGMADSVTPFVEKPDFSARRVGIISCAFIVGIRAAICAGLEAATAMILERDYVWSRSSVGIAIGLSFMVSVPGRVIFMYMKDRVSIVEQIRLNMGASFIASIFLFKTVGSALTMGTTGSPEWLLAAGSVLYCAIYQVSGLVEGIMTTFALPRGSLFTVDNVILLKLIFLDSIGRTFGPPLARMQVEAGGKDHGQDCYAWQQLSMTLAATLLTEAALLRAMAAMKEISSSPRVSVISIGAGKESDEGEDGAGPLPHAVQSPKLEPARADDTDG